MLRAVAGIDCEVKLESELPIPVVREPSMSLFGDGDLCRVADCKVGATNTIPGAMFIEPAALVTFGTLPGLTDPCLDTGIQPAATVKDAPLAMCGGDRARWLCNLSRLRARAEHLGAEDIAVAACEGRLVIVACVETDEPTDVHDREIGKWPDVGVRLPAVAGGIPVGVGVR